jgi:hypothetical protein
MGLRGGAVRMGLGALVAALGVAGAPGPARAAFDPVVEAKNFSKVYERQRIYDTPEYQARLRTISAQNLSAALAIQATDPEREFVSDLCWNGGDGCAGDVRLYDWQAKGYGIVQPVLFTARNGATLSGHVWATRAGWPGIPTGRRASPTSASGIRGWTRSWRGTTSARPRPEPAAT